MTTSLNVSKRGSGGCFSLPLWVFLVLQVLVVLAVFGVMTAVWSIRMESSIEEQVKERLSSHLLYVKETVIQPFNAGYESSEALTTMLLGDSAAFKIKENRSLLHVNPDGSMDPTQPASIMDEDPFFRFTGTLVDRSPFIVSITQLEESKDLMSPTDGLPQLNAVASERGYDFKIWNNTYYTLPISVHTVPSAMWPYVLANNGGFVPLIAVPLSMTGTDDFLTLDPLVVSRLSETNNKYSRKWIPYPLVIDESAATPERPAGNHPYAIYSVILEGPGAITNGGVRTTAADIISSLPPYLLAMFPPTTVPNVTTAAPPPTPLPPLTGRFRNKWMTTTLVDLTAVVPVLDTLTHGPDSVASIYDITDDDEANHMLIATSDKSVDTVKMTEVIGNRPIAGYYNPTESPSRRLNEWFATAYKLSRDEDAKNAVILAAGGSSGGTVVSISPIGSVRVDGRFLSFANIRMFRNDESIGNGKAKNTAGDVKMLDILAVVSTKDDYYFDSMRELRTTMIIFGVAIAVALSLALTIISLSIRVPLNRVLQSMELSAAMKNEDVDTTMLASSSSIITEMKTLIRTFEKLHEILSASQAYLPSSLLARFAGNGLSSSEGEEDEDEADEEEDDYDDKAGESTEKLRGGEARHRLHQQSNTTNNQSFSTAGGGGYSSSEFNATGTAIVLSDILSSASKSPTQSHRDLARFHNNKGKKRQPDGGTAAADSKSASSAQQRNGNNNTATAPIAAMAALKSRRVAILCMNVRGFTRVSDFGMYTVSNHTSALMDIIARVSNTERGLIDSFHGDHFVLSFNAVKTAASPCKKAAMCAIGLVESLKRTPYACVSMGASGGSAIVGSLGNSSQRRLSIVGRCYTDALKLQRASADMERSTAALFGGRGASSHHRAGASKKTGDDSASQLNCFAFLVDHNMLLECFEATFSGCSGDEPFKAVLVGTSGVSGNNGGGKSVELQLNSNVNNPTTTTDITPPIATNSNNLNNLNINKGLTLVTASTTVFDVPPTSPRHHDISTPPPPHQHRATLLPGAPSIPNSLHYSTSGDDRHNHSSGSDVFGCQPKNIVGEADQHPNALVEESGGPRAAHTSSSTLYVEGNCVTTVTNADNPIGSSMALGMMDEAPTLPRKTTGCMQSGTNLITLAANTNNAAVVKPHQFIYAIHVAASARNGGRGASKNRNGGHGDIAADEWMYELLERENKQRQKQQKEQQPQPAAVADSAGEGGEVPSANAPHPPFPNPNNNAAAAANAVEVVCENAVVKGSNSPSSNLSLLSEATERVMKGDLQGALATAAKRQQLQQQTQQIQGDIAVLKQATSTSDELAFGPTSPTNTKPTAAATQIPISILLQRLQAIVLRYFITQCATAAGAATYSETMIITSPRHNNQRDGSGGVKKSDGIGNESSVFASAAAALVIGAMSPQCSRIAATAEVLEIVRSVCSTMLKMRKAVNDGGEDLLSEEDYATSLVLFEMTAWVRLAYYIHLQGLQS